jgi:subtilisin family serine protease
MKHRRSVIALAGLTLLLSSGVANANSGGTSEQRSAARQQVAGGGEFVVGFDMAQRDAALAAIADSGGVVVDELDQLGLALVETSNADFAATVGSAAGVTGVVQNQSIGATEQGRAQVRAKERLTVVERGSRGSARGSSAAKQSKTGADPLESLQWDMAMIKASQAQQSATGKKVTVGIIDTGVDASHPDIAPNFSWELSRNFTMDIPAIDGPCEEPTCIDPPWVDDGGHGTHVAGTVAGARNGIGIVGVAPDATIVNVRAGQDSGYFFVYETAAALTYAGDAGLDVVNMSFYTDPWLFNCASRDDYVSGAVTDAQIAEQAFIRQTLIAAVNYAHDHGVTMIAAAGNGHTNYAAPTRADASSPDYPPGTAAGRVVTNNCLDLPSEGPNVLSVSSVGPSGTKSDFSDYGLGVVDVAAPGGWFRDNIGTPQYRVNANQVLSSYPFHVAVEEGLVDANGTPTSDATYSSCDAPGHCAVWTYLQGTSMASPHVTGEAALIVQAHGKSGNGGYSLAPDAVRDIIRNTATDHACPTGGVEIYTDEGRPAEFNAPCAGTTANNALYGEGIINAAAAVAKK